MLFHLAYLNRKEANFLLSSSKIKILCQDDNFEYLGYSFRGNVISIAKRTIDTIQALPDPTTQKEIQKIVGMTVYFSQILRVNRSFTRFLTRKLRKGESHKLSEEDKKLFQRLKDCLGKVHMKGYIIALDTHIKNKSFIAFSDWSFSVHSSSACLLVKIHDKDGTTVLPAVAESQTLSDSLRAKGSSLCEMGALISALHHLRPILFLAPFVVYVDNRIVLTHTGAY